MKKKKVETTDNFKVDQVRLNLQKIKQKFSNTDEEFKATTQHIFHRCHY